MERDRTRVVVSVLVVILTLGALAALCSCQTAWADGLEDYEIWPEPFIKVDGEYANTCSGCIELEMGLILHSDGQPSSYPASFTATLPLFLRQQGLGWSAHSHSGCIEGAWTNWAQDFIFRGGLRCKSQGAFDFVSVTYQPLSAGVYPLAMKFMEEGGRWITRYITLTVEAGLPTPTPPPAKPRITGIYDRQGRSVTHIFPSQVITITGENFGEQYFSRDNLEGDGVAFRSYYSPNSVGEIVSWEDTKIVVVVPEGHRNSVYHTIFIFKRWPGTIDFIYSNEWPVGMAYRLFLTTLLKP